MNYILKSTFFALAISSITARPIVYVTPHLATEEKYWPLSEEEAQKGDWAEQLMWGMWGKLDECLDAKGIDLLPWRHKSYTDEDLKWMFSKSNPHQVIGIIDHGGLKATMYGRIPSDKLIQFSTANPAIFNAYPRIVKARKPFYKTILTWDDNLLQYEGYVKYFYPSLWPMRKDLPSFYSRKNFCMFLNNKTLARTDEETYSYRREFVRYLNSRHSKEFDLFGRCWNRFMRVNRGLSREKMSLLQHYKFCFCFENCRFMDGWITERIFECFQCGTIPIYWGAEDITKYIPKSCFIDFREFEEPKQLMKFLNSITEEQYEGYLSAIREYLESKEAQIFSPENFAKTVMKVLLSQ